jgi:hypothetical protein
MSKVAGGDRPNLPRDDRKLACAAGWRTYWPKMRVIRASEPGVSDAAGGEPFGERLDWTGRSHCAP